MRLFLFLLVTVSATLTGCGASTPDPKTSPDFNAEALADPGKIKLPAGLPGVPPSN